MDIGRLERIFDADPITLPVPAVLPDLEPSPLNGAARDPIAGANRRMEPVSMSLDPPRDWRSDGGHDASPMVHGLAPR